VSAVGFEKVSLTLGRRRILSSVSFSIAEGRFVGLLGPNGAGKTTLMRAVLGLVTPQAGRISVLGEAPRRGNPKIGYMPQMRRSAALSGLSGYELVLGAIEGTRWGWPFASAADKEAAWAAIERVGAADLAHRPISQLSGGERQRLLIAQALIGNPRLLLMDEPLAA